MGAGNSAAYIRARLQRDHPEIAESLDRGEFRSARATATPAQPLAPAEIGIEGGKAGPGRGNKTVTDGHGFKPASQIGPNSQERILRRLARDAPEVLDALS